MHVVVDASASDWLTRVSPLLLRAEAENNLLLGLAVQCVEQPVQDGDETVFLRVMDGQQLAGAALANPFNLILSRQSAASLFALAAQLAESGISAPGVLGPDDAPERFVEIWRDLTGADATLRMRQRIHECRDVADLSVAPGRYRLPTDSDVPTLAAWRHEFHIEVNAAAVGHDHLAAVRRLMDDGQLAVWEHGGQVVSCAANVRRTPNGAVVAFVFTPAEQRGRGYARSCVAELTRRNLAAGDEFCCLYTDLANPVSNAIYARIGYQPVCDSAWWQIESGRSTC